MTDPTILHLARVVEMQTEQLGRLNHLVGELHAEFRDKLERLADHITEVDDRLGAHLASHHGDAAITGELMSDVRRLEGAYRAHLINMHGAEVRS